MKKVKGNEGGYGEPWAVISLTLWLSSWKEKSLSGKSTLVIFLYPISDNPSQKMTEDLKDINMDGYILIATYR